MTKAAIIWGAALLLSAVPLSAQELVGVHTSADFAEAIVPIGDPARPPPGRGVKRAWRAGALSGSATVEPTEAGSDNNFTDQKWWMDADEYPQWQWQAGSKKRSFGWHTTATPISCWRRRSWQATTQSTWRSTTGSTSSTLVITCSSLWRRRLLDTSAG